MKISKIYSNKTEIFSPILFNLGFNVILAEIKNPLDKKNDTHNLGKSLLISLIDYLLLKHINTKDSNHFLNTHKGLFGSFDFYLELELPNKKFVTIKRNPLKSNEVSIKLHDLRNQDFSNNSSWDFILTLVKAKEKLDELLNFNVNSEYNYRKGLNYFLRTQDDYSDIFKISKFVGAEINWKPYLAGLFNYDIELIKKRFNITDEIDSLGKLKKKYESESSSKLEEYDKIKNIIEVKEIESRKLETELNSFNFRKKEISITNKLISEIEPKIYSLNEENYNLSYEIDKISSSIHREIGFNVNEIKKLFMEVEINFPENLKKKYDELLDFNKQILSERKKNLKKTLTDLDLKKNKNLIRLKKYNILRSESMDLIKEKDSFNKFKELQKELINQKSEIVSLKYKLENLSFVSTLDSKIAQLKIELNILKENISTNLNSENKISSGIKTIFSNFIKDILGLSAYIFTVLNTRGNINFKSDFYRDGDLNNVTSESAGHTYKKFLCMAFDLSLLVNYRGSNFYKFVYHDGALETLDDKKKLLFIEVVKNYCKKYNIQYIFSLIDSELPRDRNSNNIINFSDSEIILKLNDSGNNGRLFKMKSF